MEASARTLAAAGHAEASGRPGVRSTEVALLAMTAIWGVNFSVVKYGTRFIPALAYNGLRVGTAVVVLLAACVWLRRDLPPRRDVVRLAALGLLGHGVYQTLFILGLTRTTVATAALVLAASPALIALVGRALGVERLGARAWGGIALQLLGVAAVVGESAGDDGAAAAGGPGALGALLMLAAALCWAVYAVSLKRYAERVHPIHLSAWTMAGGVLLLGALAAPSLAATDWARVPPGAWGAVGYSGVISIVVAYLIYYRGVRVLGPTRTAMFSNLQPLIALVVAYVTLREVPTAWQLAGAGSIMTGLLVARR